jgi:hypothetical protein
MRRTLIMFGALVLSASLAERASAAQVCAWIVESAEEEGTHKFALNLSVDAPASVAVRFKGPNFTSAAMGGDMIQLDPGEAKEVDGEGFDVGPGDDIRFDVQLFDQPMASLEEMENPKGKLLAAFVFQRKVGEDEKAPPADLAAKQCQSVG